MAWLILTGCASESEPADKPASEKVTAQNAGEALIERLRQTKIREPVEFDQVNTRDTLRKLNELFQKYAPPEGGVTVQLYPVSKHDQRVNDSITMDLTPQAPPYDAIPALELLRFVSIITNRDVGIWEGEVYLGPSSWEGYPPYFEPVLETMEKHKRKEYLAYLEGKKQRDKERYAELAKLRKDLATNPQPPRPGWPTTVDGALLILMKELPDSAKDEIRQSPNPIEFHMSLGRGIRNEFGLWQGNKLLLLDAGFTHPDDASSEIIYRLWKKLREEKPRQSES